MTKSIESLLLERNMAIAEVRLLKKKLKHATNIKTSIEYRYLKSLTNYKEIDYQLALVDGRRKIIDKSYIKSKKQTDKQVIDCSRLTSRQIDQIAAILGLDLKKGNK